MDPRSSCTPSSYISTELDSTVTDVYHFQIPLLSSLFRCTTSARVQRGIWFGALGEMAGTRWWDRWRDWHDVSLLALSNKIPLRFACVDVQRPGIRGVVSGAGWLVARGVE